MDGPRGKRFTLRCIASPLTETHRIMSRFETKVELQTRLVAGDATFGNVSYETYELEMPEAVFRSYGET